MDYDEFINSVAQRSGTSGGQADTLTCATLRTLAERIDGGEVRDLTPQLPPPLRDHLFAPREDAERFGFVEFVQRVSTRAAMDEEMAKKGIRAVFDTLREAVPPGQYDDLVGQLPQEFWEVTESAARFDGRRRS